MLALLAAGLVTVARLQVAFEEIVPRLEREALPRVQEADFRRKMTAFVTLARRLASESSGTIK